VIVRLLQVLISIPSVKDPKLAPPGKHTLHAYLPATEPFAIWQGAAAMTQNDCSATRTSCCSHTCLPGCNAAVQVSFILFDVLGLRRANVHTSVTLAKFYSVKILFRQPIRPAAHTDLERGSPEYEKFKEERSQVVSQCKHICSLEVPIMLDRQPVPETRLLRMRKAEGGGAVAGNVARSRARHTRHPAALRDHHGARLGYIFLGYIFGLVLFNTHAYTARSASIRQQRCNQLRNRHVDARLLGERFLQGQRCRGRRRAAIAW